MYVSKTNKNIKNSLFRVPLFHHKHYFTTNLKNNMGIIGTTSSHLLCAFNYLDCVYVKKNKCVQRVSVILS